MSAKACKGFILTAMRDILYPAGFRKSGMIFTRDLGKVVHLIGLQSGARAGHPGSPTSR
jgi:hypothetical protein